MDHPIWNAEHLSFTITKIRNKYEDLKTSDLQYPGQALWEEKENQY